MKIVCDQHRTHEALQRVVPVVARTNPNPIVQYVRMVAADDRLDLYATDLEVSLSYTVGGVQIERAGEVCLPAKRVGDIFKELPKGDVELFDQSGTTTIRAAGARFAVHGRDPGDFPRFPQFNDDEAFTMSATDFKDMVDHVAFAVASEKGRYALNGVLLEVRKSQITMVGSDGKRLSKIIRKADVGKDYPDSIIVPPKGMQLIKSVCADADEIRVLIRQNQLLARTGGATVTTQLVEGLYPDYEQVIPSEHTKTLTVNREDFIAGLRRAALLTSDELASVRFSMTKGQLVLTSRSPEAGEAEITVPAEYTGDDLVVGFDPQFVLDVLRLVRDDDIVLHLKDAENAAVIRSGKDFVYLIMPTEID